MGQRFSTTEKRDLKDKIKRVVKSVLPSDKQYGCGDELHGNITHQLFAARAKHEFTPAASSSQNRETVLKSRVLLHLSSFL
jgi:hypothetical protein